MFVQRVVVPSSRRESWTVIGGDGAPVEPVEQYLAFLSNVERSPNTVKAYAHDLKDWFVFLGFHGLDWRRVGLDDVGEFVCWLRLPPAGRDGRVVVLPSAQGHCGDATVNRKLSAVSAFYQHQARHGVDLGDLLRTWQPAGPRGAGWRPFLHHISKRKPEAQQTIRMKAPVKLPRVLTAGEALSISDACDRLRDRLLFAVLLGTGIRVGEALGLRHEDWAVQERQITVVRRDNDNGARSKSWKPRTVPIAADLVRLYADYLHGEYGDLDSDYVFVNLWGEPRGHPLSYAAVYDLVKRLRQRTGVDFDPHWYRHSYATGLLRTGVPVEVVSKLLGHASVTTTAQVYGHLTVEDTRIALERAGWFTPGGDRL